MTCAEFSREREGFPCSLDFHAAIARCWFSSALSMKSVMRPKAFAACTPVERSFSSLSGNHSSSCFLSSVNFNQKKKSKVEQDKQVIKNNGKQKKKTKKKVNREVTSCLPAAALSTRVGSFLSASGGKGERKKWRERKSRSRSKQGQNKVVSPSHLDSLLQPAWALRRPP